MAGRIEIPQIVCQKELQLSDFNERVIPLAIKKGQGGQKLRIPFKNNGPSEVEVEFSFVKQTAVIKGPQTGQLTQSPVEFSAVPNTIKIASNSSAILNIVAKLKNSYQLANISKEGGSDSGVVAPVEKYNHLLLAKVKDSQLMFSFIIEASVLESSGKDGNM